MSIIVADTSPLNLLIQLRQEAILPAMFGQVVVPKEVVVEMGHPKAPEIVRYFVTHMPTWLTQQAPSETYDFPTLDLGESAAIALAIELRSPLLIDERDGRAIARTQGVEVIGAIGVLERAADQKLIMNLESVYNEIRSLKFHVADDILQESLERHMKSLGKPNQL